MTTRESALFECPEEIDLTTQCEMIMAAGFIGIASAGLDANAQRQFRGKLLEALAMPGDDVPEASKFIIGVVIETAVDPSYPRRLLDRLTNGPDA